VHEVKPSIKEEVRDTQSTDVEYKNEVSSIFQVEFLELGVCRTCPSTEPMCEPEVTPNLKMECLETECTEVIPSIKEEVPETQSTELEYENEVTSHSKYECLETKWDHTDDLNSMVSYILHFYVFETMRHSLHYVCLSVCHVGVSGPTV
jgi:hypothetical protein